MATGDSNALRASAANRLVMSTCRATARNVWRGGGPREPAGQQLSVGRSASVNGGGSEEAEMRPAFQAIHALAHVLGLVDVGARQLDLGVPALGFQHDVVGVGVLVGHAQIFGLEHGTV